MRVNLAKQLLVITAVLTMAVAGPQAEDDYELQATVQTPDIEFVSDTDIGLWARFHFAIHTEDFKKTREFYRQLGFTQGISGFPLTNTHAMARALACLTSASTSLSRAK